MAWLGITTLDLLVGHAITPAILRGMCFLPRGFFYCMKTLLFKGGGLPFLGITGLVSTRL